MYWQLLPHATICAASDRLILLDRRQDRYLMVPGRIADSVTDWLMAEATKDAPETLIELLQIGGTLGKDDPQPSNADRVEVAVPQTLAAGIAVRDIDGSRNLLSIIRLVAGTWLGLRSRGFDHMLRRIDRQAVAISATTSAAALTGIAAYDRERRYVPLARNCLLDSLAQYRWLDRAGIGCRLVFGVTGAPFAAHCWLQSDDTILNDSYEHVSRFTPILAL
ncbi:MAG: lasso peptide biosynthesis B2 protein [Sphingomonas sp.]|jgi:hypothetical protein|uniref:lasso peptide biosynthesis B2 protein n=1 Tax=Sphingomonas sp. TaxID=28214 RepID=UPI0035654189